MEQEMSLEAIEVMLEAQPETAWFPTTPAQADWCIKKINESKAIKSRLDDIADEEIEQINAKKQAADAKYDREISFFTSRLRKYFDTLNPSDLKETKTQYKYPLLSGSLVMTKSKPDFEKSDDELLAYLELNNPEFVKVEKKPAWGEFKKRLTIINGSVIDKETGEIVTCVTATNTDEKFEVKS